MAKLKNRGRTLRARESYKIPNAHEYAVEKCYIEHSDGTYSFDGTSLNYNRKKTLKIKSFYKGKPVTRIYPYAFRKNYFLEKIILPTTLVSIEESAFSQSKITSIVIPKSVTSIETKAFLDCRFLKKIEFEENSSLTEINENAFRECTALKTISLPKKIKTIREGTFENCFCLSYIDFPENLKTIEANAFINCVSLELKELPHNLKKMYAYSFYNIKKFLSDTLVIPKGMTEFNLQAFSYNINIKNIHIPETVSSIKGFPFIKTLENIIVDSKNPYFYSDEGVLFNKKHELVVYPSNKKNKTYIVPSVTKKIQSYAFLGAKRLDEIVLHKDVTTLGNYCLKESSIVKIILPSKIKKIPESCFEDCLKLEHIEVSDNLKDIYSCAFYNCLNLKHFRFPKKLKFLGKQSFYRTSISSVELFDKVEFIDYMCFGHTPKLKNMIFHSDDIKFDESPFDMESDLKPLLTNYDEHVITIKDEFVYYSDFSLIIKVKGDPEKIKKSLTHRGIDTNRPLIIDTLYPEVFKKIKQDDVSSFLN